MERILELVPNRFGFSSVWSQIRVCDWIGFLILLCLFLSNQALARLGESEIAIEKRFGEPQRSVPQDANMPKKLQERASTRVYQITGNQDGALIEVTFLDGKSCREFYFLEREKSQTSRGLNEAQVRFILEVNAQGSGWDQEPAERSVSDAGKGNAH